MKKILALVLLGAMLVLSLASCGGSGDDQLKIGVILIGDVSAMARMTQLLEKHATYQEVME